MFLQNEDSYTSIDPQIETGSHGILDRRMSVDFDKEDGENDRDLGDGVAGNITLDMNHNIDFFLNQGKI